MKYFVLIALVVFVSGRLQDFRQHRAPGAFDGDAPRNNHWWPVTETNAYKVCADRCAAGNDGTAETTFRVAELKDKSGKVLEQYCCHPRGTARVASLGADHSELQGWDGTDGGPTFDQLDPQSRVCPPFERVETAELQAKFGYAWFNQRTVSCPWTGEF